MSSSTRTWRRALSTSASGTGCPYFLRRSFWREPAFTPILTGTFRSLRAPTTSFTFHLAPMFPGFILRPSTPCSKASSARRQSKCMSAIRGIFTDCFILPSALAAVLSGTASLTISQPSRSSARICLTVALTSRVSVLVMDCTETGLPPPTGTGPTKSFIVLFLFGGVTESGPVVFLPWQPCAQRTSWTCIPLWPSGARPWLWRRYVLPGSWPRSTGTGRSSGLRPPLWT